MSSEEETIELNALLFKKHKNKPFIKNFNLNFITFEHIRAN